LDLTFEWRSVTELTQLQTPWSTGVKGVSLIEKLGPRGRDSDNAFTETCKSDTEPQFLHFES